MKKPGMFTGALVSLFLTVPLIVIFFLGWRLAGLSFVPYNVFDWVSRVLPGTIIIFSIESMVKVIRFFSLGSTAATAKTIEHLIAIFIFLIAGIVAGTIVFSTLHKRDKRYIPGIIAGVVSGVLILLIDLSLGRMIIKNEIWDFAVFIIWGLTFGWIYNRMMAVTGTGEKEKASVVLIDRRKFLIRLGSASAAIVVTGAVVDLMAGRKQPALPEDEGWSATHELPNAGAKVKPAPGTRPELTPVDKHYRIDIDAIPPSVNEANWRLKISGLVEKPVEFSLQEIKNYEPVSQFITLTCISNPVGGDLTGTQRWTGTSLQQIIPDMKLKPSAAYLRITSADGYFETVPVDLIRSDSRLMLTYAWDGLPLTRDHGFPLRIYIPDRYGMKQPKWIESIEAIDQWEAGYWVVRGWDKEAIMKATSVIDTIAVRDLMTGADGSKLIPVGGIAHAGDRGISKVEVSIDNGEWTAAELRTPLSDLTWVIWRYNMPFQEGEHTLTVRCYDGKGTPQIITPAPPYPSGASGLDTRRYRT